MGEREAPDLIDRMKHTVPSKRLSQLKPIDLGSQAVGSNHDYAVPLPTNESSVGAARGSAVVSDSGDIRGAATPMLIMRPNEPPAPIAIRYAPTSLGSSLAELSFIAQWDDGYVERQSIAVTALSRKLTDPVPQHASASADRAPGDGRSSESIPASDAFSVARERLISAVTYVFDEQVSGVADTKAAQHDFVRAKPEHSIWWDLAELAIQMGAAVVGAEIGAMVEVAVEKLIKAGIAELSKRAVKAVGHGVEEGFQGAIELATKSIGKPSDRDESENRDVNFFTTQTTALHAAAHRARVEAAVRADKIETQFGADPDLAVHTADALSQGLETAARDANRLQREITTAQFMTYLARRSLGKVSAPIDGVAHDSTRLEEVRTFDILSMPTKKVDGLLDIYVLASSPIKIERAHVRGVATKVAERLLDADLTGLHMPMRIIVGETGHVITRDELGRIRSSGLGISADGLGSGEAQNDREAQRIVEQVLARTLAAAGVGAIETDQEGAK